VVYNNPGSNLVVYLLLALILGPVIITAIVPYFVIGKQYFKFQNLLIFIVFILIVCVAILGDFEARWIHRFTLVVVSCTGYFVLVLKLNPKSRAKQRESIE
jgi:membrane protein YdbS with pleckstrin-like domain